LSWKLIKGRGQEAEGKAEGRRQRAGGRGQEAEGRRQRAGGRGQEAEGRRMDKEGEIAGQEANF